MKNMERRRKYSRHFLQIMQTPPVLLILPLSILLVLCSVVHYADCIMTFPDDSGVYSLFPDEDLKTGRKRFRFDEETTRSYRDGRDFSSSIVRSYPMLPHDRFHRPVDYSGSRQVFDRYRDRQSRVYFDDNFRSTRFDLPRITPRPRPIERPGPIIFETSRPLHHHFLPERFPPPAIGQSKLPVGASGRASGEDVPTRIHIFNPESNSFGNPRNAGGDTSSERTQGPPSNFVETGPPGPESFLNHEEFLEYQKKIAFARFHEQDPSTGNGGGGTSSSSSAGSNGKKVLFESKEPFEIDGLVPPDKSGEISGKLQPSSQVPVQQTTRQLEQHHHQKQDQHNVHDQRQHQRQGEGQKVRPSAVDNHHHNPAVSAVEDEKDTGGGEVDSGIIEKGEEEESENGKSEVTQLPPTHNTKSGRAHSIINSGSSGSASTRNSKFTPSISHNEQVGGTRFRLPTTAVSYSSDDEPPNLNGFVPVVPFHLIAAEQPRAISLERQRQQQQQRIIPHPPEYISTTTTSSTTARSVVPVTITTAASTTTTSRSKGEKSGLRGTEVTKSFSTSSSSSSSSAGTHENVGSSLKGFSSPASPILHATAGERSNSETLSKVAITKQQELKRLQKQRQLMHQLTTHPHPGLFPDIGLSDSSSSSDSADNSDKTPGTYTNTNDYFDDTDTQTLSPPDPIIPPTEDISSSFPSTSFDLPDQDTKSIEDDTNNIHSHTHITSNTNHTTQKTFESKQPYRHTELTKHNSVTQGDETIKSTSVVDTNNEIFDTRAVKTANGIRQGEFHLEGYMVKNGDGSSSSSRSSIADRADDYGNKYEETVGNLLNHRQLYDYSDNNNMPRVGITSPMIIPDTPLSPAIPSQLPGTTTPDLQQKNEQEALTPSLMNTTPSPSSTMSSSTTSQHDVNDDGGDVTGNEYFSRSNGPTVVVHNKSGPVIGNPVDAFDSEPTSPEPRRTRLSENDENSFIPPNSYYVNYRKNNFGSSYTDYYANSDNKINSRSLSSTSSKSKSSDEDSRNRSGGSLLSSSEYVDENGAFDHRDDDFYRLGKAFRYGSYVNGKRKQARKARKRNRLEIIDASSDLPSSISIPVQATLTTGLENLHGESINSIDVSNSLSSNGADYDPNAPLYLESSETLINKTYYLDGNYEKNNNNSVKSSNFIKVTRIKVPSGPTSKETAEKTSSAILARRTPKQAVIISETAAGVRPRVVGSVVEAGPAWPGLVSNFNFLRPNRTTFTATVRPRGNSGTNPTHPTSVITHHVQHQMKQQESPKPTHFQLQQIRQHPSVTAKSIDESNHHQHHNRPSNDNRSHNASNTGITINKNGNGVVKIINKINSTAVPEAHVANRRLYSSSEENASSTQIKSNSSTGVVSMVHAHISHCPKLHSPTEILCDVHIREGHGIPNPQLTVGWRRKFYNSTQPDILLALNKTPNTNKGRFDPHHSIVELEEGRTNERLEDFHDKFNVTLAPGISPMLRSVLLIRSVTAPDTGTYNCEVTDGINVLKSETLLFLCH